MAHELRDEERKSADGALRKERGVASSLPEPLFTPARGGSGRVRVDVTAQPSDLGRWVHTVLARHEAKVYGYRDGDTQPTGTPVSASPSLRDEGITESRADTLGTVVQGFEQTFGREPSSSELGALLTLVDSNLERRRLGAESAVVPPGSHSA